MQIDKAKIIAAKLLKCGKHKIWANPEELQKISEAMTKDDIRGLIANGIIKKKKSKGQSRGRARELMKKKKKGRRRGYGSRRGTKKARKQRKKEWMSGIRSQRKKLKELKAEAKEKGIYAEAYRKVNGNFFRGKKHLERFIKGEK